MPVSPEQRARRAAQRATARRVHARGGYQRVIPQRIAGRAREAATKVERQRREQWKSGPTGQRALEELRTRVRAHKREAFGDDIKWRGRGSDDAIHKYPAPAENYQVALNTPDREDLRDLARRGEYNDGWKFLYYH